MVAKYLLVARTYRTPENKFEVQTFPANQTYYLYGTKY